MWLRRWSETPTVTSVNPSIVATGDVITVSGKTLVADRYHTAVGHTHRRMDAALKQFERVYITAAARNGSSGGGDGEDLSFPCELSTPSCDIEHIDPKERCPTMYDCTGSAFQCRVPSGVPSGVYNVSFLVRTRGGRSMLQPEALGPRFAGGEWTTAAFTVTSRVDSVERHQLAGPSGEGGSSTVVQITGTGFAPGSSVEFSSHPGIQCPVVGSVEDGRVLCDRKAWVAATEAAAAEDLLPATCLEVMVGNADTGLVGNENAPSGIYMRVTPRV